MDTFTLVLYFIFFGIIGAALAGNKGRGQINWFLLGGFFPLALIILACLKRRAVTI